MAIRRHFLGWDAPALPRAARWLLDASGQRGIALSDWTVVVPGSRASRRFVEALIEQATTPAIAPPRIVTAGQLPELLYTPTRQTADSLMTLLARIAALRDMPRDRLQQVITHPPEPSDIAALTTLAQQLNRLHETLAADGCSFAQVIERAADLPPAQQLRWDALAELQQAYEAALDGMGLIDLHAARRDAIEQNAASHIGPLVLLATADLNRTTCAMLETIDADALIHTPQQHADRFDHLGCIMPDAWRDLPLDINPADMVIVDQPRDTADALIRTIDHYRQSHPNVPLDDITIGLGDETQGAMLQRTLDMVGLPAHLPAGRVMSQLPPALLLDAMATFVSSRRLDDFTMLVRHGDFEDYYRQTPDAPHDALNHLDQYAAAAMPTQISREWFGAADDDQRTALQYLFDAVAALLPEKPDTPAALPKWSDAIANTLATAYKHRSYSQHNPDHAPIIEALSQFGDLLSQQAMLDPAAATTPHVTFAEAVRLTLTRLGATATAPDAEDNAIEMLGWLELQLDDAPLLLITAVNEGSIPQSQRADPFLPDALRSTLGLTDNARRYARDRMMLEAILTSRADSTGRVVLFAARRDAQDNPLPPSRLTLACDPRKLPAWVQRFYGHDHTQPPPLQLITPGERSRFVIPVPRPPKRPLDRLSVTAFRAYLACPYRFYLQYVERLAVIDDRVVELDALAFGTLAHDVLQTFGSSDLAHATDAATISNFLSAELDAAITKRHGQSPRPAILIQAEMLRRRLDAFAYWQAKRTRDGWRIVTDLVEVAVKTPLDVDGEPFTLSGKIDRVDLHDTLGYAVLDYKTGDTARKPDKAHRNQGEWIDLQLPLYRDLAAAKDITGNVQLGYINLPKSAAEVGDEIAPWTTAELDEARETARQVVRNIRNGIFYPPKDPPTYADGFEAICMDRYDQRSDAIKQFREAVQR